MMANFDDKTSQNICGNRRTKLVSKIVFKYFIQVYVQLTMFYVKSLEKCVKNLNQKTLFIMEAKKK